MKIENRFYIGKEENKELLYGYHYDTATGSVNSNDHFHFILFKFEINSGNKRIEIKTHSSYLQEETVSILVWDANEKYLGFQNIQLDSTGIAKAELSSEARWVGMNITVEDYRYSGLAQRIPAYVTVGYEVFPHYKKLEKKYKKENSQAFFRESLDGKINLWGADYELIKNTSLEDILLFKVYRGNAILASASFNKSDCKFDRFKKSVELALKYDDKYTKILDAYENTYDLIKLAPAITALTLTKRSVVQIYIQGEKVISNYSGGTYWETDIDEPIDNTDALTRKYYFSKGPKYIEVDLEGFSISINAAYSGLPDSDIWNAASITSVGGVEYKAGCSIKFTKVANAGDYYTGDGSPTQQVYLLSDGKSSGLTWTGTDNDYKYKYDTYRIEIYDHENGEGTKLYQSISMYGKDGDFTLAIGEKLYPMYKANSMFQITPESFNLGAYVIEYQIWGRLLCDVDKAADGTSVYDLPYDDFATPRRNYKKCIGLTGFDSDTSTVKILRSQNTSSSPTPYGRNDFGEYFLPPASIYGQYYYPLARSAWANTSIWVLLDESLAPQAGFEKQCSKYYREYTLKNSYHIADVIKALLAEIDTTIMHEKSDVYSQFLYGHSGATAFALGNCDIYITQKTNILKGEYDQAAQKAEIKFKQLMDMLRDCFRCYWFIDKQNRFRIEHITYFLKGMSYDNPSIQLNMMQKYDKFNKLNSLYCQQEIEFDKSELASRFEFKWMDDVTDSMGNLQVDINNSYIQKDKTEEINIDGFTSDIDYMLFLPDNFSNDGFALLLADSNKKVPIVHKSMKSAQFNRYYDIYPQNWYASFNQLINHYMDDMPGGNISSNNTLKNEILSVTGIKKCMKHEIEFPANSLNIDTNKLITTEVGNGYIEEMSSNLDTDMTKIELRYEPE